MPQNQEQPTVVGTRVAATARLFAGDSGAVPTHIGFLYSTAVDTAAPDAVTSLDDVRSNTAFTLYKAPIVGAIADGSVTSLHAVTAGSAEPGDYVHGGTTLTTLADLSGHDVYIHGAVLLSRDGSVVDWMPFPSAHSRPVGYEFSLTWKLTFS